MSMNKRPREVKPSEATRAQWQISRETGIAKSAIPEGPARKKAFSRQLIRKLADYFRYPAPRHPNPEEPSNQPLAMQEQSFEKCIQPRLPRLKPAIKPPYRVDFWFLTMLGRAKKAFFWFFWPFYPTTSKPDSTKGCG
jgi:hypothetical protein